MELSDLAGKHLFDGIDFLNVDAEPYEGAGYTEDSQVCRFRLDNTVWVAAEDPSDGYRSSMRDLSVHQGDVMNAFPAVEVFGIYRNSRDHYSRCDILELYDIATGKLVLEVGTDNTDDYYPSFVASFHPENMSVNAEPSHA
jgi:hypothetical protein